MSLQKADDRKILLEATDLSQVFQLVEPFEVLQNVSLQVKEGEFVCILGPSGCGKTVLLYLLAGFISPTHGRISQDGQEIVGPGTDRVMLFQDYVLFPWKTVLGNVLFGANSSNLRGKELEALALHQLEMVGLLDFRDWYPYKLSGGMQQRVALARALIGRPRVLLMDEPFSALDAQYRRYLRERLVEIWQRTQTTIVFVTHSITESVFLGETIYLLTKRPASIKKTYKIDLPHPRDRHSSEFRAHTQAIEQDLSEEFEIDAASSEQVARPLKDIKV